MGFSMQDHCRALPFPSPGDLPRPGIELMSPASVGEFFTAKPSGKPRPYLLVYKTRQHRPQRCVRITGANRESTWTSTGPSQAHGPVLPAQPCTAHCVAPALCPALRGCGPPHPTQLQHVPTGCTPPHICTHQHGSCPGNTAVSAPSPSSCLGWVPADSSGVAIIGT